SEHVEAAHALEPREHVTDRVVADVAHVDAARRVREHLEAVELRTAGILDGAELFALVPDPLPLHLDLTERIAVGRHRTEFWQGCGEKPRVTAGRRAAQCVPGGATGAWLRAGWLPDIGMGGLEGPPIPPACYRSATASSRRG